MKKIITIVFLLLINNVVFSQEKSTMDLLMNKEWRMERRITPLVFTETKIQHKFGEDDYYLSETPVYAKDFDESKVGMARNGKYIVTRHSLLEIKILTEDKLFNKPLGSTAESRMFICNSPSGYLEYYAEVKQGN